MIKTAPMVYLEELLTPSVKQYLRKERLLKQPKEQHPEGWFFFLREGFDEALDIKLTHKSKNKIKRLVWTQGTNFFFKQGDILYDCSIENQTWIETIRKMKYCIQVKSGIPSTPQTKKVKRFSGSISFDLFKPNKSFDALKHIDERQMTQDDFIRFIMIGPEKWGVEQIGCSTPIPPHTSI